LVFFVQIWPRPNGASSSGRSMPTRRCCARRPEPEAARRRGTTECRRRGSGQAERPAGWCDMSWSMTPTAFSSPLENRVGGRHRGHEQPDRTGQQRLPAVCFLPAHQPHSVRQRRSPPRAACLVGPCPRPPRAIWLVKPGEEAPPPDPLPFRWGGGHRHTADRGRREPPV
jgi:hypothetical protein